MSESTIAKLEEQLLSAMKNSDVAALNQLLADDLIFTSHFGQCFSKQDDLEAHRLGIVKISSIQQSEQEIKIKNDVAIVSVLSRIQGEFGGNKADDVLRFTRIWHASNRGNWQLIAAHSSQAK